jgi:hypothetical protein
LSDITYVPTEEGWLYLAAVLDLYSRRIVGWGLSQTLATPIEMGLVPVVNQGVNDGQQVHKGYTCHGDALRKMSVGTSIFREHPRFVNLSNSHQSSCPCGAQ